MSVKAMGWAYDQRVNDPVRKAVLVALGNVSDEDGYCWPSIRRIAWMAEVSPRTAQRAVQDLEAAGFLHIERDRFRDNGAKTSNAYRLPLEARQLPFDVAADAYDNVTHTPRVTGAKVSRGQGGGDSAVTPIEQLFEPSLEPSIDTGWPPKAEWASFVALRNKKGKPITPKARELLFKKLAALAKAGHKPEDVLLQSVENGWTGIFPVKAERGGAPAAGIAERNKAAAAEFTRTMAERPE